MKPYFLQCDFRFTSALESSAYLKLTWLIRHLHICHNAPYFRPKVCISIVFNFSWDGCNTQENWKTKVMHYGNCASSVWCEANKYLVNLSISVVVLGAYALNKYKPMSLRCLSATLRKCNCIFPCSDPVSLSFSFDYNYTCRRVKWGEHGTYVTLPTLP